MKSTFSIAVERAAKYTTLKDGSLMVYFESAGKKEDTLLKQYFKELRSQGHPFDSTRVSIYSPLLTNKLSKLLRGIDSKKKSNPVMQLADLCLYPVIQGKEQPNNKAFLALKDAKSLVDCYLEPNQLTDLGIKYYCFDNT